MVYVIKITKPTLYFQYVIRFVDFLICSSTSHMHPVDMRKKNSWPRPMHGHISSKIKKQCFHKYERRMKYMAPTIAATIMVHIYLAC
jgi:hypothetical protein